MRRLFTFLIVAATAMCFGACARQVQSNSHKKTLGDSSSTEKKEMKKKGINEKWEEGDSLVKFRFECHANGGGIKDSEVLHVNRTELHDYLYLRPMSSSMAQGTNYEIGTCQMLLDDLAAIVQEFKLYNFDYVNLEDFDMKLQGWAVTFTTTSGKEYSVVQYGFDEKLQQRIDKLINAFTAHLDENEITGPHSIYNYYPNGNLSERIDYDADGTVMGGYDPDNPLNTY